MTETAALLEGSRELAGRFKDSELYQNYCRHKKNLESDPPLLAQIEAYKKSQFELETKRLREGSVSFDEEKRVAHQYTQLSLSPVAGAFLTCEHELLELYRQALDTLCEACEIEF